MKPEMSTAVMIERLRALASESQDSVLLSSVASRIELLLAAESGMSREMACIRHALDIPPDQSVQSGVVDAFVRLNAKIQDLSEQLAELRGQEPAGFRWRYRADNHSGASAWTYLPYDRADDFIKRIADKDNTVEYGYVFSRPVPPAASQHVPGEPDYWVYDTKFGLDISREKPEHEENVEPYFPVFKTVPVASQPCAVPNEVMRVLGFFASVIKSGEQWTSVCQHEYDTAIAACRAAMLQGGKSPVIPDDWVLVPLAPTPEMTGAAIGCGVTRGMGGSLDVNYSDIYTAMVSAAPQVERKDGDA
ncbi:hypothetical protein [Pectobacterium versatile]|uniref:hypothetical protein n=1 Tax=Pectobacterium versatile TaxID=2488639 RepID=UPI0032F07FD1